MRPAIRSRCRARAADTQAVPWQYVVQHPQVMFFPNYADYAKLEYEAEHMLIPAGIEDPTWGLFSPAGAPLGPSASQVVLDTLTDIIVGRRDLSEYDQMVKDWQSQRRQPDPHRASASHDHLAVANARLVGDDSLREVNVRRPITEVYIADVFPDRLVRHAARSQDGAIGTRELASFGKLVSQHAPWTDRFDTPRGGGSWPRV